MVNRNKAFYEVKLGQQRRKVTTVITTLIKGYMPIDFIQVVKRGSGIKHDIFDKLEGHYAEIYIKDNVSLCIRPLSKNPLVLSEKIDKLHPLQTT